MKCLHALRFAGCYLGGLLVAWSMFAQQPAAPAATPAATTAPAAPAAAPATPASSEPASSEPATPPADRLITGSVDFGYRATSGTGGNYDAYRSLVDLNDGPRVFGAEFHIINPSHRWFDDLEFRAQGFGGEPYNTVHAFARKTGLYNLTFDYRDIAYFDALPSFADPTIGAGIVLNQNTFDTRRHTSDVLLELFPGTRLVPYFGYSHDGGSGHGITDFALDATNSYAVADSLRDHTDLFRAGVRLEHRWLHATLEEGGTVFKQDDSNYDGTRNNGNLSGPILGTTLYLGNLLQAYGIRGHSEYSKALVIAEPAHWVRLDGQFVFSQPKTDVNYFQVNNGQFVNLSNLLFYTAETALASAANTQPHVTGSAGVELKPLERVRVIASYMTDRLHEASSGVLTQQFNAATQPLTSLSDFLALNYNRFQTDVLYDATKILTLRGGYRHEWGDSTTPAVALAIPSPTPFIHDTLGRDVGLFGGVLRFGSKLRVDADAEIGEGNGVYFRTSLNNYRKGRMRVRYQPISSLMLTGRYTILDNQNPDPQIRYDFRSQDIALSLMWTPAGAKRFSFLAEYDRSMLRSDLTYLAPQTLTSQFSYYRDYAHIGTAGIDYAPKWPAGSKVSVGGSFFLSTGSRPTDYYQPFGKISIPIVNHMQFFSEWRWYGYSEPFYLYEGFRTHLVIAGLRLTR